MIAVVAIVVDMMIVEVVGKFFPWVKWIVYFFVEALTFQFFKIFDGLVGFSGYRGGGGGYGGGGGKSIILTNFNCLCAIMAIS